MRTQVTSPEQEPHSSRREDCFRAVRDCMAGEYQRGEKSTVWSDHAAAVPRFLIDSGRQLRMFFNQVIAVGGLGLTQEETFSVAR